MKLNQKGISLLEVLAVVTIIGILSTLTFIGVSRYLSKAQNNAYDHMGKSLYEATKSYFITNSSQIPSSGVTKTITASTLINDGFIDSLIDPKNKKNGTCNTSTIKVIRNASVTDNIDLTYTITIICNGVTKTTYQFP